MQANAGNTLMKNVIKHRMKSKAQNLVVIIRHQLVRNILFGIISSILRKMVKFPSIAYFVVSIKVQLNLLFSLKSDNEHKVLNIHRKMPLNVENIWRSNVVR